MDAISFRVNGQEHTVSVDKGFPATTSLNDYLRDVIGLTGTKVMCNEAGCGCCAVTVSHTFPDSDKLSTYSIQSCLTPLWVVDGWQISTVEGIGNQKNGFHPIQSRLAEFSGSQCGYCTPGFVMNMYGLLHQDSKLTSQEIEDNFDGNICRCTGYRPILDAMKSFANDCNVPSARQLDIEDLNVHLCPKTGDKCFGTAKGTRCLNIEKQDFKWYRPSSVLEASEIITKNKGSKIKLVFGNTGKGIFKNEEVYNVFVDLHGVKDLFIKEMNGTELSVGSGITLTELISILRAYHGKEGFSYFEEMIEHLKNVGNVMVRNAGSIGGNLMLKKKHPEFPSDVYTLFEAAGAKIKLFDCNLGQSQVYPLKDFFRNIDMERKIVCLVLLPKLSHEEVFKSFKVTPRCQNAQAYVNAAFRFSIEGSMISKKPSIVFGGISSETVHAEKTEEFLENKKLNQTVLKESLSILEEELNPNLNPVLASPKFRKELACSFLYKVFLQLSGTENARLICGKDPLYRPLSSGLQVYQEKKSEFPLKQAMPKKTAPLQASGEAVFVNDMPKYKNELFGAFVLAMEGNATLLSLDTTEAVKMPGVISFLSAEDIPENGVNNYMPCDAYGYAAQELFATKEILFCGQAVGIILAETKDQALKAASKVKINYAEVRKPILNIEESIAAGKEFVNCAEEFLRGQPDDALKAADHTVAGEIRMGSQTHFFIENHISLAVPSEDGMDMFVSTQYGDMSQCVASSVIGKPMNFINVTVPRVGGAFGGKTFDCGLATAAASLSAYCTGRPVRVATSLSDVMAMSGRRTPILARYKAGVNNDGKIQVVVMEYYMDCGCNDTSAGELFMHVMYMDSGYHIPHWKIQPHAMMTNKQRMSSVRAPGGAPAVFIMETIVEHAAKAVNMHPILFKELNLIDKSQVDAFGSDMKDSNLQECWYRLKDVAEVEGRMRQVNTFNQDHLWKKQGITMTALKYGIGKYGAAQGVHASIYARDGTVFVSQSGVEMGQGLYTKVAQAVAHVLGIPIDLIKVRPNQNGVVPNAAPSGGSTNSLAAAQAAMGACRILNERMQPIKEKFPDLDWKELCAKCASSNIDLSAQYMQFPPEDNNFFSYFVYAAAVIETEVDILTGESQIKRVDIMADLGESLNPAIDIGQIEGAFVLGLGCYLFEDMVFDENSGRILNDGTWDYKPPMAKDIPIDWRIHLLPDKPNPVGILSSKAVGEPPLCLSVGALLANKAAVLSARQDLFGATDFLDTVAPYTVEKVHQSVGLDVKNLMI